MRLEDAVVGVTGASSGMGKAIADAYVSEGADVGCIALPEPRLTRAVDEIADGPGDALAVPGDVRDWSGVREMVEEIEAAYGPIDVWVNVAGITQIDVTLQLDRVSVDTLPVRAWDGVVDTNLHGVFFGTRAVLPGMLSRNAGRLLHMSSGFGSSGGANRSPYVASKFGLEGLHETLALELEGTNVDSMTIRPPGGGVFTELSAEQGKDPDDYAHEPDVVGEMAVRLAAGEGENGGRYIAREDGEGYTEYAR